MIKTIVIVSHSLDVVKKLCTRAIWIYKGEFRLDGDPIYVIDEYLKQVAIDHKEEKKKAVEKGIDKYKGTVYIDAPKDFHRIKRSQQQLEIRGWEISDCENSNLRIFVDDEECPNVVRMPRLDVLEAYAEQYGGFIDGDTIGWKVIFDVGKYILGKDQNELTIRAVLYDSNNVIINSKDITIYIDND